MVSEGVDIPRLRVGVYATPARTELFFRQVVGRFIRRTAAPRNQMAWLFLPSDQRLKQLAATIEEERNHALDLAPAAPEEPVEVVERAASTDPAFRSLSSGGARLEDDLIQTTNPGDQLGLFGAPAPSSASPALAAFTTTTPATSGPPVPESASERRERLRDERQALVAAISRRTGEPYRAIHARINKRTGAASVAMATADQLEKGNALLEREASR
jgi:superfamily II DNA or RNA helicase